MTVIQPISVKIVLFDNFIKGLLQRI